MTKLLILCIESNPQKQWDKVYVDKIINMLYKKGTEVKTVYKFFSGKGNYSKLEKEIEDVKKRSSHDEAYVIYFIDTDNYNGDIQDKNLNEEIERYCHNHNICLVWFCRNIEEVFWHKSLHGKEKSDAVKKFNSGTSLQKATIASLSATTFSNRKSNLLCILDRILNRKTD